MSNEIISYIDMCSRERASLQRGMNFALGGGHSVILMSVRSNAPYRDRFEDDGTTLIYEGHDEPKTADCPSPKTVDQPGVTNGGRPTQNGRFSAAAREYAEGKRPAELVRVYEKIRKGIWSYNGHFELHDAWITNDGTRNVYEFKLIAIEEPSEFMVREGAPIRRRIIPTSVKLEVWQRDGGKCTKCGAEDELHFDHVLPFSKGGTSVTAANVQLLCARHNLRKSDRIE